MSLPSRGFTLKVVTHAYSRSLPCIFDDARAGSDVFGSDEVKRNDGAAVFMSSSVSLHNPAGSCSLPEYSITQAPRGAYHHYPITGAIVLARTRAQQVADPDLGIQWEAEMSALRELSTANATVVPSLSLIDVELSPMVLYCVSESFVPYRLIRRPENSEHVNNKSRCSPR
ncbi:hypothetical protein BV22DRAFT_1046263 [Leucogyrophana mollusca]|uniref:Uncharacterized protein n=1 Tax=Leucogyrophana mollusca TaxID=85980 RepID=A0ACB8BJZ0_9AGAM|nr:hypothetical protein BV22DRAFT_1046263 [Leucogyrophana mollusca]